MAVKETNIKICKSLIGNRRRAKNQYLQNNTKENEQECEKQGRTVKYNCREKVNTRINY